LTTIFPEILVRERQPTSRFAESPGSDPFVVAISKHLAGVKDAEDKLTDTGYKRDVFTNCTKLCKEKKWSELVPFMQNKTMRFEVVDEDGWKARLKKLLEEAA